MRPELQRQSDMNSARRENRMALVDITLKLTPDILKDAPGNAIFKGHLGTHFDVMDKEFPLEYTRRNGVVFDVSSVRDRDIEISDIDMDLVDKDMFVAFHTGWIEEKGYGTKEYNTDHPQLSDELIDALLEKGISIIGIDCYGVRRGAEHTPKDHYCADRGVFIIENLCNLDQVIGRCVVNTYPVNISGISGLPCRVIAEKQE